jgi:hypothetical protein
VERSLVARRIRAGKWALLVALLLPACGSWPSTRMEPAADYGSGRHVTVSSAPAFTAGPTYVTTTSPDGATTFVCADGDTRRGDRVPPDQTPAC